MILRSRGHVDLQRVPGFFFTFFDKSIDLRLSLCCYLDIPKTGGDILGGKKLGRPTDNPKPYKIAAKLDQESKDILDAYCAQESVSVMEAVRRGLKRLKPDLKK